MRMRKIKLIAFTFGFACSSWGDLPEEVSYLWNDTTPQSTILALGVEESTPITNGFVFIDGRYIPPPYIVKREGNGIFINGNLIEERLPWPVRIQENQEKKVFSKELPVMPDSITEATPSSNRTVQKYISDMQTYYLNKYGESRVVGHMITLYQSLPCIEKVLPHSNSNGCIVFWKGESNPNGVLMYPTPPKRGQPTEWTQEKIIMQGRRTKEGYETRLARNSFFILPTIKTRSGRITGSQEGVVKILLPLVSILESSQTSEEVFERMKALDLVGFSENAAKAFFENRDSITPELKARIETLKDSLDVQHKTSHTPDLILELPPAQPQKLKPTVVNLKMY